MHITDQNTQPSPQLLFVGRKDTERLLEVYVKRSLSLNDGALTVPRSESRPRKWVTLAEMNKKIRRYSSDTSLHLHVAPNTEQEAAAREPLPEPRASDQCDTSKDKKKSKKERKKSFLRRNSSASQVSESRTKKWIAGKWPQKSKKTHEPSSDAPDSAPEEDVTTLPEPVPELPASDLESSTEKERKHKKSKKSKKPSFWKSFLGFFSRSDNETKEEQDSSTAKPTDPPRGDHVTLQPGKSFKRRQSRRKHSLRRRSGEVPSTSTLDPSINHIHVVQCVEPTNSYYENMSEELEKIVIEAKDSPTNEHVTFAQAIPSTDENASNLTNEKTIERIIALIKQEGDVINGKLKESASITSFFDKITYSSFQQLADHYVESEAPEQRGKAPVAAPELVKLAFTLDFTARVAGLSNQATGNIMGFGNQYLKDRFTHMTETRLSLYGPSDVES